MDNGQSRAEENMKSGLKLTSSFHWRLKPNPRLILGAEAESNVRDLKITILRIKHIGMLLL